MALWSLVECRRDHRQAQELPARQSRGGLNARAPSAYRFVHNNPMIEMRTVDFTNDPFVISRNDNMVAINSALQVDLTGQVCANWIGTKLYSGVGGQADFMRGAARSDRRQARHRPALDRHGRQVRASCRCLIPGAGVTTTRNDVHYVGRPSMESPTSTARTSGTRAGEALIGMAQSPTFVTN